VVISYQGNNQDQDPRETLFNAKKKVVETLNKPGSTGGLCVYSILEVDRVFLEDIRPTRGARLYYIDN
jgi:hypothetical protein